MFGNLREKNILRETCANLCEHLLMMMLDDVGCWLGCLLFCWQVAAGCWPEFWKLPLPNLVRDLAQTCVGFGQLFFARCLGRWIIL